MAFVLEDVINEIEETRSLEPLKKLKKENLVKVAAHEEIFVIILYIFKLMRKMWQKYETVCHYPRFPRCLS